MDFFMTEVKTFCKGDDTCLFLILVLLGFLICMFFSRTEGFSDMNELEKELEEEMKKGIGKKPVDLGMKMNNQDPVNGYGDDIGNKYNIARMGRQYVGHIFNQLEGKLDRQDTGLPMPWVKTHNDYLFEDGEISKFGFDRPLDNDLGKIRPNNEAAPSNYKGGPAVVEGFTDGASMNGVQPASSSSTMATLDSISSSGQMLGMNSNGPQASSEDILKDDNVKNEFHVVLFYTPWCGHSKRMLPDFDSVIDSHHGKVMNNHKLHIVKVDMEEDPQGNKPYKVDVKGFPTTYSFVKNNGNLSDGKLFEPRKKQEIIDEIKKRLDQL